MRSIWGGLVNWLVMSRKARGGNLCVTVKSRLYSIFHEGGIYTHDDRRRPVICKSNELTKDID